jgi:hypothetical protein
MVIEHVRKSAPLFESAPLPRKSIAVTQQNVFNNSWLQVIFKPE